MKASGANPHNYLFNMLVIRTSRFENVIFEHNFLLILWEFHIIHPGPTYLPVPP